MEEDDSDGWEDETAEAEGQEEEAMDDSLSDASHAKCKCLTSPGSNTG